MNAVISYHTWTCMVCGADRMDADIGVETRKFEIHSARVAVNVRYCRDHDACHYGAVIKAKQMEEQVLSRA